MSPLVVLLFCCFMSRIKVIYIFFFKHSFVLSSIRLISLLLFLLLMETASNGFISTAYISERYFRVFSVIHGSCRQHHHYLCISTNRRNALWFDVVRLCVDTEKVFKKELNIFSIRSNGIAFRHFILTFCFWCPKNHQHFSFIL